MEKRYTIHFQESYWDERYGEVRQKMVSREVNKEEYQRYYQMIDTQRHDMQATGECKSTWEQRLYCTTDCAACPHYTPKRTVSLDALCQDDGEQTVWLESTIGNPETELIATFEHQQLVDALSGLPDKQLKACLTYARGLSLKDSVNECDLRSIKAVRTARKKAFDALRNKLNK